MSAQSARPRGRSANIFINYRREDSSGHAGRLFDALSGHFAGRLFMDIDTLQPGVDFVDAIEQAVGSCEVLIVVIGREWLTIHDAAGHRRLDDPADFVRLELESALARNIRVIPVLVQDAPMPRAEELPPSLARLARRNAIELSDARWAHDVQRLSRTLQDILREHPPAPAPWMAKRVWLSLAALVVVAAVVLASVRWKQPAPTPEGPRPQDRSATQQGDVAVPKNGVTTKGPASGPTMANPTGQTTGASGGSSAAKGVPGAARIHDQLSSHHERSALQPGDVAVPKNGVVTKDPASGQSIADLTRQTTAAHGGSSTAKVVPGAERIHDQPSSHRTTVPPHPKPTSKFTEVEISLADEPIQPAKRSEAPESPAGDLRAPHSISAATLPPPQVTITSPAGGETVGPSVQVQGTVVGLGDQRVFLCIRQPDGAIYPRGELFPKDGRWSIQLRSSKERTFQILVVISSNKEAAQALSDQKSRDDGLRALPAGASISGGAVAVKRKWKPFGLS